PTVPGLFVRRSWVATGRTPDCDLQPRLLLVGELPESWIPQCILELGTRVHMRKPLIDQRTAWQQRIPPAAVPAWDAGRAEVAHRGRPRGAPERRGCRLLKARTVWAQRALSGMLGSAA